MASASWDSTINLWDLESGALLRTLTDSPANPIYSLQVQRPLVIIADAVVWMRD